jgi:hypothetical protein
MVVPSLFYVIDLSRVFLQFGDVATLAIIYKGISQIWL